MTNEREETFILCQGVCGCVVPDRAVLCLSCHIEGCACTNETGELPASTRLDKFDAKFGEQNGYNIRGTGKYKGFIAVSGGTAHIPISDTDGEEVHQKELEDAEAGAMVLVAFLCLIMAGLSSGVFVFAAQKKEKALYVYGCWTLVGGALLFAFVGIVMTMVK